MKILFTLQLIVVSTIFSFAQKAEQINFMSNLKLKKWRSTESFSDSTLTKHQIFHLIPTSDNDSLSSTPILWIDTIDSLTVEYNKFDSEAQASAERIVRYAYTYDSKKKLLTIFPKNRAINPVVFKVKVIRPGQMLELSRIHSK
jgi:hypothetical protein